MTHMPAITLAHPGSLIAAVFTPWIAAGIALLIGFFASYLTALSWADLTFVLPATAFGNVIVALLSKFWLHEPISLARWAGIVLITIGVGFVAQGPSLDRAARNQPWMWRCSLCGKRSRCDDCHLPFGASWTMDRRSHDRRCGAVIDGGRSADRRRDEVDRRSR